MAKADDRGLWPYDGHGRHAGANRTKRGRGRKRIRRSTATSLRELVAFMREPDGLRRYMQPPTLQPARRRYARRNIA